MDSKQRETLRQKIEEEITKTKSKIKEYKEFTQPIAPENAIGRVSRMDAINNKSIMEAAQRKAEEKLNQLEVMQSKIDEKNFGDCARCGQAIPVGRLLLMPQSRFCVNCAGRN